MIEKLIEISETSIPQGTRDLVRDMPGGDAAQIGWANCFMAFKAALEALQPGDRLPGGLVVAREDDKAIEQIARAMAEDECLDWHEMKDTEYSVKWDYDSVRETWRNRARTAMRIAQRESSDA